MPTKTNNTVVLLNFNDVNNPYKDECGNIWTSHGNPVLEYNNDIEKYVLSLNQNNLDYLLMNKGIELGGQNFTIDGSFYVGNQPNTISYTRIFEITISDKIGRFEFALYSNTYYIYLHATTITNISAESTKSSRTYKNEWLHFAIVHDYNNSSIKLFLDGKIIVQTNAKMAKYTFPYICLGSSTYHNYDKTHCITGKFGFFRIAKESLYDKEFDSKEIIINKIDDKSNYNTKRLFSFNYDYNTSRTTKWNQKANMYVIDPNHYALQAKSIQE